MAALLVLRAVLTLLLLRGGNDPAPDADDPEPLFLSADAAARPEAQAAAGADAPFAPPVRRRRSLWPGWAKMLAASVPFAGLAIGLAAVVVVVARTVQPESVPPALANDSTILALVLLSLSILAVWILWRAPQWQAAAWAEQAGATPRERFEIENASRGTLGQILSGVAVLAGLIFAWQQLGSTTRSVQLSEQGQLTDRFTSAIGQLASEDLPVRLGGIYALEQIARDNPRDYAAAMQVLAAIVRGDENSDDPTAGALPQDVVVAMTVIGRRTPDQLELQQEQGIPCLDLSNADVSGLVLQPGANLRALCLGGADLSSSNLPRADFTGSVMNGTILRGAQLEGSVLPRDLVSADMSGAFLAGTQLVGANLTGANLSSALIVCSSNPAVDPSCASLRDARLFGTDLSGATFIGAKLGGANVSRANLDLASFTETDLSTVDGMTAEQLAGAFVSPGTALPPSLSETPEASPESVGASRPPQGRAGPRCHRPPRSRPPAATFRVTRNPRDSPCVSDAGARPDLRTSVVPPVLNQPCANRSMMAQTCLMPRM